MIKAVVFDNDGILAFRPPSINEEILDPLRGYCNIVSGVLPHA